MKTYTRLQSGALSDGCTSGGPASNFGQNALAEVAAGTAEIVDYVPVPEPYTALRAREYPPLGDQLDALWHAMGDGTLPKVAAFYDPVTAVKAKYPKA